MKIVLNFSNGLSFPYRLNNTKTAASWLTMMGKVKPSHMSRQSENHRHGFASHDEIRKNIQHLTKACDMIGMPKVTISSDDFSGWQKNLNDIHREFPIKLNSGINNQVAHTCNLLIHWLEYELTNAVDHAEQYLFNLDFNHQPETYNLIQEIPFEELNNFTTNLTFGSLNLHYVYIGRHYLEMCNAQDFVCLKDQFAPQRHFNATSAIHFSESRPQEPLQQKMLDFYHARGGKDFFQLDYKDPRMAKGFFKLGEMENVNQYSLTDRKEIRESLATAYVVDWKIEKSEAKVDQGETV
ncbi:MAG: hypothetical protein ACRBCI_07560 [Cellvibrionaceae bacterium]